MSLASADRPQPVFKARKGDLVIVHKHHRDYVVGKGTVESDSFEIAMVESCTRDGFVKSWRNLHGSVDWRKHNLFYQPETFVVPSLKRTQSLRQANGAPYLAVHVEAVMAAARKHTYPLRGEDDPGWPKPFDSLEEAREFVRGFVR